MKLTVGATGIKQAIAAINKDAERKKDAIKTTIRKTAINIEGDAKQLCPVDTGRLRASIDSSYPREYEAFVGTEVEYAEEIENGSSRQAPNGFLFPASEMNRAQFLADITNILKS